MSARIKSDPSTSRSVNRRLVLDLLRRNGAMSRAALALATGLSAPAVTSVVADLIRDGFALEGRTAPGALGRRPVPIALNYAGRLAIGVKLMVDGLDAVVTDLSTTPLSRLGRSLPDSRPDSFVTAIAAAVAELTGRAAAGGVPLVGIGVSLPGTVDSRLGLCRRSERLDWTDVPFAALLAERTGTPVWLEDDTNAFALAQHFFGLGRDHATMAALAIGAGISCAIVSDGKLFRGGHGAAGKIGHVIHDETGPLCECGRRGCLQAWFSERAIVATWDREAASHSERGHAGLLAALAAGDPAAQSILGRAGEAIGQHLARFVATVDPEIIVVGGEAVAFGEALFGPMRATLARLTLRPTPPLRPDWDDAAWARGAAALATQHVFDFEEAGIAGP